MNADFHRPAGGRSILVACSASLLSLCRCTAPGPPPIRMGPEICHLAEIRGFDYRGTLDRAQRGDASALSELMRFSLETESDSHMWHGIIMVELLQQLGDNAFASVAERLSSYVRQEVASALSSGEDSIWPPLRRPLRETHARTYAALLKQREPVVPPKRPPESQPTTGSAPLDLAE